MSRNVLLIGALVLVAAAVGLVLWLNSSDDPKRDDTTTVTTTTPPPVGDVAKAGGAPTVGDTPRLPDEPAAGSGGPREYAVGDTRVRDHRSGDNAPLELPPQVHPAEGPVLPSQYVHAITQQLRVVIAQCATDVPKAARGADAKIEGQLIVQVKAGEVSVTKSTMLVRDVGDDFVSRTKQCIEQRAIGLKTPAADQPDIADYSINLSFPIM